MFEDMGVWLWVGLLAAAFAAGLIDSMVGGGGLIQIPALFGLLPQEGHASLLGTNKVASAMGTGFAAFRYSKVVHVPWNAVLPAATMALVGGFVGAYIVTQISGELLRFLLPVLLTGIALYTFFKKDLGRVASSRLNPARERFFAACTGLTIGLYDGFFGPGTGSFLMVSFVVFFGFDFLMAAASAKWVNMACNLASLAWFVPSGHVLLALGLGMGVFNVLGAHMGSAIAIKRGTGFVRRVLLGVVFLLILKTRMGVY